MFNIWVKLNLYNKPIVYVYNQIGDTIKNAFIIDNYREKSEYLNYYNGTSIDSSGILVINFKMKYNQFNDKCYLIDSTSDSELAKIYIDNELDNFKLGFWVKKSFVHSKLPTFSFGTY